MIFHKQETEKIELVTRPGGPQYLAVLSPVFIHLLITRVSGIPMLKEAGMKRWGDVPEYKEYLKNTPELVPFTKKFW